MKRTKIEQFRNFHNPRISQTHPYITHPSLLPKPQFSFILSNKGGWGYGAITKEENTRPYSGASPNTRDPRCTQRLKCRSCPKARVRRGSNQLYYHPGLQSLFS